MISSERQRPDLTINEIPQMKNELLSAISSLRRTFDLNNISIPKVISVLEEYPCYLRCYHELKFKASRKEFDPLYTQKHDYLKKKTIDAIVNRFPEFSVHSEYQSETGTYDIVVENGKTTTLTDHKRVTIELKSGKSIDIFQIIRYLFENELLLVVRVPTHDVVMLKQSDVYYVLKSELSQVLQKIKFMQKNGLKVIQGEWCEGCSASCRHARSGRPMPAASVSDLPRFVIDVNIIVEKILIELEKEYK